MKYLLLIIALLTVPVFIINKNIVFYIFCIFLKLSSGGRIGGGGKLKWNSSSRSRFRSFGGGSSGGGGASSSW